MCSDTATGPWLLSDPSPPVIGVITASDPTTCGGSDGELEICGLTSGESYDIDYEKDGVGQTTVTQIADGSGCVTLTGLSAASYDSIIVTHNATMCSDTATGPRLLSDPSPPVLTCTGDALDCNGDMDGTVSVSATGASPFTYNWEDASNPGTSIGTGTSVTGLSPGTYTVTVTDDNGCTATCNVVVTEPAVLTATCTGLDDYCLDNVGQVSVSVGGGTSPYTYLWDDPGSSTTATVSGLGAGTYSVTVTDANGCSDSCSVSITNIGMHATSTETYNGCEGDGYSVVVNGTTYDEGNPTGTEVFIYEDTLRQTFEDDPGCSPDCIGYTITGDWEVVHESTSFAFNATDGDSLLLQEFGDLSTASFNISSLNSYPGKKTFQFDWGHWKGSTSSYYQYEVFHNGVGQGIVELTNTSTGSGIHLGTEIIGIPEGLTTFSVVIEVDGEENAYMVDRVLFTSNDCDSTVTINLVFNPNPVIGTVTASDPTTCGGSDGELEICGLTSGESYDIDYEKDGVGQTTVTQIADGSGCVTLTV